MVTKAQPQWLEATRKVLEEHPDMDRADQAAHLGIKTRSLQLRIRNWFPDHKKEPGSVPHAEPAALPSDGPIFPTFTDDDIPTTEIIAHLSKRAEKKLSRQQEEQWFPIKMPDDRPFGLVVLGDPHLGTHANWPLLQEHVAILKKGAGNGLYAVNIGDTIDAWPISGRLARLWSENDISHSTEWKLVRWFFHESGIDWLVWLLGNHDNFPQNGAAMFKEISRNVVPVMDAEAKFVLTTPNGSAFPVWARHDFRGHSQFNTLHAAMRSMRERADVDRGCHILGVEGHKHQWAIHTEENPDRGYFFTVARARGYKIADDFAKNLDLSSQEYGASVVWVCNPQAKNLAQMNSIWPDVEEGAAYLTWLRKRFK